MSHFIDALLHYCVSAHRVWRYRGGRDGRETVHQFMSFLGRQHHDTAITAKTIDKKGKVFAGVVTFCVPHALECEDLGNISSDFQVGEKADVVNLSFTLSYLGSGYGWLCCGRNSLRSG